MCLGNTLIIVVHVELALFRPDWASSMQCTSRLEWECWKVDVIEPGVCSVSAGRSEIASVKEQI